METKGKFMTSSVPAVVDVQAKIGHPIFSANQELQWLRLNAIVRAGSSSVISGLCLSPRLAFESVRKGLLQVNSNIKFLHTKVEGASLSTIRSTVALVPLNVEYESIVAEDNVDYLDYGKSLKAQHEVYLLGSACTIIQDHMLVKANVEAINCMIEITLSHTQRAILSELCKLIITGRDCAIKLKPGAVVLSPEGGILGHVVLVDELVCYIVLSRTLFQECAVRYVDIVPVNDSMKTGLGGVHVNLGETPKLATEVELRIRQRSGAFARRAMAGRGFQRSVTNSVAVAPRGRANAG